MKTLTWHFVLDSEWTLLAAFPERSLALWYSEGTNWKIEARQIQIG